MSITDELREQIKKAEQATAEKQNRHAIIDDMDRVHGYVEEGNQPVSLTTALTPTLNSVLDDNGDITATFPVEIDDSEEAEFAYENRTVSPSEDEYIDVLDDVMNGYHVKGSGFELTQPK